MLQIFLFVSKAPFEGIKYIATVNVFILLK